MVQANNAYACGDEDALRGILAQWDASPESVRGEGVGPELIRVIRKIDQIGRRLKCIELEVRTIRQSDLYKLSTRVEEAEAQGRDLLSEMVAQVEEQIAFARERLKITERPI